MILTCAHNICKKIEETEDTIEEIILADNIYFHPFRESKYFEPEIKITSFDIYPEYLNLKEKVNIKYNL